MRTRTSGPTTRGKADTARDCSALKEVKIPPGPRLRILQHVAYARAAAAQHRAQPSPYVPQNNAVGPLSLAVPVAYN